MKTAFIILAGLLSLTASANEEQDHPCRAEVKKLCGDKVPGKGAIVSCLKEKEAELSPACKAKAQEWKEKREEKKEEKKQERRAKIKSLHESCKVDLDKFCKDAPLGRGAKIKCLLENKAKLSAACQSAIPAAAKK